VTGAGGGGFCLNSPGPGVTPVVERGLWSLETLLMLSKHGTFPAPKQNDFARLFPGLFPAQKMLNIVLKTVRKLSI
jgi:hypothetical protein